MIVSCKNGINNNSINLKLNTDFKTDSTTVSSSDKIEIVNIVQPEKTVFRNIEIDTTKLFGTWTQDPTSPFADFHVTGKSFNIIDYDGGGVMPYILDKKEITVFYRNAKHKGIITLTENDTLKIKWSDNQNETEYVKVKN